MKDSISGELIEAARNKNEPALAAIIAHQMPTIRYFAGAAAQPGLDFDDAVQEGIIGLFNAVQTFDPQGTASFVTYASVCVQNAITSAQRAANRKKHTPLNQSVPLPDNQSIPGPEEQAIASEVVASTLDKAKTHLSPLEREVLFFYLDGFSYSEIAQKISKPPKAVENAIQRIRRKLK